MSFYKLPNEVLTEIFFQIKDQLTLFNLSLCSRRFHEVVEPALYNVFRDAHRMDLVLFLRTILENPRLGLHVRTFEACDRGYSFQGFARRTLGPTMTPPSAERPFSMDSFGQDDWKRLRAAIRSAIPSDYQAASWADSIHRHQWEAVVALMFVLLPRLEHLCLELSGNRGWADQQDDNRYCWMTLVLSYGWGGLPNDPRVPVYMKYLKEVTISPFDTEMPISMPLLLPYLKLKSVATLNMEFLEILEWERIEVNLLPTKNIALSYSGLAPAAFRLFLQCFPSLERLSYEHDGVVATQYPLQPVLVGRALAHLKHSLRELILIDENPVTVDYLFSGATGVNINRNDVGSIGSLVDYTKLEVLDIMYHILITPYHGEGDDIRYMKSQSLVSALPSSIRSLTVRYCPEDFITYINELFDHVQRFPLLSEFTVVFDRSGPEVTISKSSMRIFREQSIKHGISLDMQYLGVEKDDEDQ